MSIRIILAEDHKVYRETLVRLLSFNKDIAVIAEAENGQELIDKIPAEIPDVILLDLNMPVLDGYESLHFLKPLYPTIKFIILSMTNSQSFVNDLLAKGCSGYLTKDASVDEIIQKIKDVMTLKTANQL